MEISDELIHKAAHYLGTTDRDPDEKELLRNLIQSAYGTLYAKTGVDWLTVPETSPNFHTARTAVMRMVFQSYYGDRDDSKNTAYLKSAIAADIFSLQMSEEARAVK